MSLRILGVDPGTRITGFGAIEVVDHRLSHLHHGVVSLEDGAPLEDRLAQLADEFNRVLDLCRPEVLVLERIFLGRNVDSAFKLGHARGVLMAEAARRKIVFFEYAARQVKKGVTGRGGADKNEVQLVVRQLLGMGPIAKLDASDALALACHHAFECRKSQLQRRMVEI